MKNDETMLKSLNIKLIIEIIAFVIAIIVSLLYFISTENAECGFFGTSSNSWCGVAFITMFAAWPLIVIADIIMPLILGIGIKKASKSIDAQKLKPYKIATCTPIIITILVLTFLILG